MRVLAIPSQTGSQAQVSNPFHQDGVTCPLNVGDVLAWDQFHREPDEQMQIKFEIALNEPQVIYCQPLLETLKQMVAVVESLIMSFKTYF